MVSNLIRHFTTSQWNPEPLIDITNIKPPASTDDKPLQNEQNEQNKQNKQNKQNGVFPPHFPPITT
jgi:hypothetical protein